jgi:hypothetical protein
MERDGFGAEIAKLSAVNAVCQSAAREAPEYSGLRTPTTCSVFGETA